MTDTMAKNMTTMKFRRTSAIYVEKKPVVLTISPVKLNATIPEKGIGIWSRPKLKYALIYMEKEINYECTAGKNMIVEDLEIFADTTLKQEATRSGNFQLEQKQSEYILEVSIDSVSSKGNYNDKYFAFIVMSRLYQFQYPISTVYSTMNLKKNNQVVLSKKIESQEILNYKMDKYPNFDEYSRALIKNFGLCFRTNNEKIVKEVNTYFSLND